MTSYSELLQTMLGMVLFSIIMMTSTKMMLLNSSHSIKSEAEKKAVSIAQSYINKARLLPFDDNSKNGPPSDVPEDFTPSGPEDGTIDDFDDYHTFSETIDWSQEDDDAFSVDINVLYVSGSDYEIVNDSTGINSSNRTVFKKIRVQVTSEYLTDRSGNPTEMTLSYLRRYY